MDELFAHPQARAALGEAASDGAERSSAAFTIAAPARQSVPLVFASPHSGRNYPPEFIARSRLDPRSLRRSEDCFVDQLFSFAPTLTAKAEGEAEGAPLLCALFPRAYVDPNREPYELDPAMFADPLPDYANTRSPRVAAGLGTVAKVVAGGAEIYRAKLGFEEVRQRIEQTYWPYHEALRDLLRATWSQFGGCLLLDCHSMPSGVANVGPGAGGGRGGRVDFVLGDCHGSACDARIVEAAETELRDAGYRVARNQPYAGGFITRHYGRPPDGIHALQIEINRALYMDERRLEPAEGFKALQDDLKNLALALSRTCGAIFSK